MSEQYKGSTHAFNDREHFAFSRIISAVELSSGTETAAYATDTNVFIQSPSGATFDIAVSPAATPLVICSVGATLPMRVPAGRKIKAGTGSLVITEVD